MTTTKHSEPEPSDNHFEFGSGKFKGWGVELSYGCLD